MDVFGIQGLTRYSADGSSTSTDFFFETTGPDAWTGTLILTIPAPGTVVLIAAIAPLYCRRR